MGNYITKSINWAINKTIFKYLNCRTVAVIVIILLYGVFLIPSYNTQSIDQYYEQFYEKSYMQPLNVIDGQILFSPMYTKTTYLIDTSGTINHTWSSDYFPGEAVRYLGGGAILRTIKTGASGFGGAGGGVQKVLWDGAIVWDFRYNTTHHDILPLPNGNILMLTWEIKTYYDAMEAGRIPNSFFGDTFTSEHIIEVKPNGLNSGEIVWEWRAWDHLIQDFASGRENYGIVEDHPELIDINYGINHGLSDWLHMNSIDYNVKFDQILVSVHNFNEIWVIDHSTTAEESAGHSGGNSGKGGDILYRWGNPQAYRAGTSNDQKFFSQHDANWIDAGFPGAGNIIVFNNGVDRPDGPYSSVDEIVPPVNENGEYFLEPEFSYGPENPIWSYIGAPVTSFYSAGYSSAQRLEGGNTLICEGTSGRFFEVTPDGSIIWQYINPYFGFGSNAVFKIVYIPPKEELKNHLPSKPIITGETNGAIQKSYNYTIKATDPDQDDVEYLIDWGDNTNTLTGFNQSGKKIIISHMWNTKGIYNIKVKAIDYRYAESDWATFEVNMPKITIYNPIIQKILKILELFPLFEKILNQILI